IRPSPAANRAAGRLRRSRRCLEPGASAARVRAGVLSARDRATVEAGIHGPRGGRDRNGRSTGWRDALHGDRSPAATDGRRGNRPGARAPHHREEREGVSRVGIALDAHPGGGGSHRGPRRRRSRVTNFAVLWRSRSMTEKLPTVEWSTWTVVLVVIAVILVAGFLYVTASGG